MKLDTIECSFRDNIELNQVVTEEILSQGSKIRIDVQTLVRLAKPRTQETLAELFRTAK